ncbi:MAG: cell wall metabolism sensor histidine kinase WalK, partial [Eubacterium sp.]|nr:cell wall metabolism sensor histidine kinase WalK [Eubacterium sp.]
MNKSVLAKAAAIFALFALLGFGVVYIYFGIGIEGVVAGYEARELASRANSISAEYAEEYGDEGFSAEEFEENLRGTADALDVTIRVIDTDGRVIISTDESADTGIVIEGFTEAYTGSNLYTTGNFYGSLDAKMLSVVSPVTVNYKVRGYVTIHASYDRVSDEVDEVSRTVYITFALVLLMGVIVFVFAGVV